MDDPAQALQAAENALRLAIREVCPTWHDHLGDVERLRAKQAEELRRRDGVAVSDDLLAYAEFHQLTKIVLSVWEPFKPIFDDKKRTEVWFGALEDVRNAIAHSRQLVAHERQLVAGISGQLRNQVTLYRTRENPATGHYAVIERVQDNFGVVGKADFERTINEVSENPRLEVGDVVTLECVGSDARDRDLEWIVRAQQLNDHVPGAVTAIGRTATISVPITESHVGEYLIVTVFVRPVGARFTKHGKLDQENHYGPVYTTAHDDADTLYYAVNPPVE